MPDPTVVAQHAASGDQATGRSLHLTSRFRGRLEALETAIAAGDRRQEYRLLLEMGEMFQELQALALVRPAA